MLPHFFVFAFASAFSPILLTLVLVMLAAPQPHKLLVGYLLGGMLVSVGLGVAIIAVLGGLGETGHHASRHFGPGVDIAVGVLGIGIGVALEVHRRRRPAAPAAAGQPAPASGPKWAGRILDKGSPLWMFLLGMILGVPGIYYLAALKDIGTDEHAWSLRVAYILLFNAIAFVLVWVPLVSYLLAPERTRAAVGRMNAWLTAHLLQIGVVVAVGVGVYELVRGLAAI